MRRFASLSLASGVRSWRISTAFSASTRLACSWATASCWALIWSSCIFLCLRISSSSSSAMCAHSEVLCELRVARSHVLEDLCREVVYQLPTFGRNDPASVLLLLNQLALLQLLNRHP